MKKLSKYYLTMLQRITRKKGLAINRQKRKYGCPEKEEANQELEIPRLNKYRNLNICQLY